MVADASPQSALLQRELFGRDDIHLGLPLDDPGGPSAKAELDQARLHAERPPSERRARLMRLTAGPRHIDRTRQGSHTRFRAAGQTFCYSIR